MSRNRKKVSFRRAYLIYAACLMCIVAAASLYVYFFLRGYEAAQPEQQVRDVIARLTADAADGTFWDRYSIPQVTTGKFERDVDVKKEYLALYTEEGLTFSQKNVPHEEDELYYSVENGGFVLADVKLKASGPPVTKLAIFSLRDWTVESVNPVLTSHSYKLSVPADFTVSVNGVALTDEDGAANGAAGMTYTVSDIYLKPNFQIADQDGNLARYTLKNDRVLPELYDYTLTLPATLTVKVNGAPHEGCALADGLVRHDIVLLEKPTVTISDYYGNTIDYEGGDKLPLTHMTITADEDYTVRVDGSPVPTQAVTMATNPDYAPFAEFVPDIPKRVEFRIAVLKEDAEVSATDPRGEAVPLEPGAVTCDLTRKIGLEAVPEDVSKEVDVVRVAQNWSLFMTNDLRFSRIAPYLIAGSYQYQVATKYATGVDITFTSKHTLLDPAFTDVSATNFVWITDDCFSVDISFIKHMRLKTGRLVDDPMNDRFYFVKYDDTDNGVDDPAWKLASMKEIINDAGM